MHVLGFTDKIPEYFRAVDLLVTKAGPGNAGGGERRAASGNRLRLHPGQERGNVDFVRRNGLGLIALNGAAAVVRAVKTLIAAPTGSR